MKKYITIDDFVDVVHKIKQRGLNFILSKININGVSRTKKTFNQIEYISADWYIIPKIKERWNKLITGDSTCNYEKYLVDEVLKNQDKIKLISFGSGYCSHEIELAKYSIFDEIICVDVSEKILMEAEKKAKKINLKNIKFICADINKFDFEKNYFDIVFFHSSLHHFDNINFFLENRVKPILKDDGLLVINEYVGETRLQFSENQIKTINKAIKIIPEKYRIRSGSKLLKRRFYGPGILRMIIADPSECIDSQSIRCAIYSGFKIVVEKAYGGNILMSALKDISHHFVELNPEKENILKDLFLIEDDYMKTNSSDFVFGVYRK